MNVNGRLICDGKPALNLYLVSSHCMAKNKAFT